MEIKVVSFAPSEEPDAARAINQRFKSEFPMTWQLITDRFRDIVQEEDLFQTDRETDLLDPAEADNFIVVSTNKFMAEIKNLFPAKP
jgi:hypothetical protein